MQRITQANLDRLAEIISKETGKTYTAGQHFGLRWTMAENESREVLNAPSKATLYDLMHAFVQGVRDVNQTKGGR